MLKIAEYNTKTGKKIDLKELEQFGLKPKYIMTNENTGKVSIAGYYSSKYFSRFGWCIFRKKSCNKILNIVNRIIRNRIEKNTFIFDDDNFVDVDLLYDLIEAGYVIKESE